MSIFKTKGYRDIDCVLSIAAIFPPPSRYRQQSDGKKEDDLTFHFTIVNDKDLDTERSAFIQLDKNQLQKLNNLLTEYLKTGITKEI